MDFNNKLKKLRKENGLSQSDLAKQLGVGRTTVTSWETGDNIPGIDILDKLASIFKVSADYLLGRSVLQNYAALNRDTQTVRLLSNFSQLNDLGKIEATKRVSELTQLPKYCNDIDIERTMPIAAHSDALIDEKELKLMQDDIDEL